MRTKCATLILSTFLMVCLLLPPGVSAKSMTMVGSLEITGGLTTELVGFAVIANPGLEKAITVQIPPLTFPVFVDGEAEDEATSKSKLLTKNFDTTVVLTNTTGAALNLQLKLRDAGGTLLSTTPVTLAAHATKVILVSDLLP